MVNEPQEEVQAPGAGAEEAAPAPEGTPAPEAAPEGEPEGEPVPA